MFYSSIVRLSLALFLSVKSLLSERAELMLLLRPEITDKVELWCGVLPNCLGAKLAITATNLDQ